MMTLAKLMEGIEGIRILGDGSIPVRSIRYDSRRVSPGDLFAAIRGEHFDGTRFIKDAADRGAAAFLVPEGADRRVEGTYAFAGDVRRALALASRNLFDDPSSRLKVVGITGTNGKTTTSYIIHGILEGNGISAGLIGTVQYLVGGQVISAARTTPEAPDLYGLMDGMVKAGSSACVMEVSSHALTLSRIQGVSLEVAVFTNLTRDHLDFHRDMEAYFRAKAALFETPGVRHRVVNRDDTYGKRLLDELGVQVLTYGMADADIVPVGEIRGGDRGTRCTLSTPWGQVEVNTSLPGDFNLYNVMAATAACGLLGLTSEQIGRGLAVVGNVPGRFEKVDRGQPWAAIVDYAHTPDALENLLANTRKLTAGRVLVVFGCGGDRDRSKRPLMGEAAGRLGDVVYVTSDNPRSEDPSAIIDDIMEGLAHPAGKVVRVEDRREAIAMAVAEAREGDMVVVAGKGHENYQIIGQRVLPFSDVDELSHAIGKAAGGTS
ncbi:MAG: UDP-N-acetylmuramoyl-L-alanyl-D-glutamate--2,6-diaminopimelate ligase [bacterium]|nr:UDP-N-acetylmuramoyl-L-alanyl-D-glutamate--2,6-diaminopimelate ligase [bacterium]MDT8395287.1 UDP-N-acetylmuramoyl-L-alanyl-D-glutamate--2,6-diaminopimelate ligase [bacterium]